MSQMIRICSSNGNITQRIIVTLVKMWYKCRHFTTIGNILWQLGFLLAPCADIGWSVTAGG